MWEWCFSVLSASWQEFWLSGRKGFILSVSGSGLHLLLQAVSICAGPWTGRFCAAGIVTRGYLFRYAVVAVVLIVISMTEAMNPLIFFLGYMSLKVTAYLQPITHKLCNRLFGETDPVPEPVEEPAAQEGEIPAEQ